MQTIFDAIEERQRFRAESTTREIFEIAGEDIVVQRSQEDPELQALLGNTIEAAMRTGMEAKRKLLARAAAAAFQNDERIDPATCPCSRNWSQCISGRLLGWPRLSRARR